MRQTPFIISDLLRLIGSYLDLKDHKACALVCKAWHIDFQPLVWYTLYSPNLKYFKDASSLKDWRASVEKNIHFVKSIVDPYWCIMLLRLVPDLLLEHCRSLVSFHIALQKSYSSLLHVQLIKINPGLQQVTVSHGSYQIPFPHESLWLEALAGHSRLRRLELTQRITLSFASRILETCPSLRELSFYEVMDGALVEPPQDEDAPTERQQKAFALRCLSVERWCTPPGLSTLLSSMPTLESFALTVLDKRGCKELTRLIRNGQLPMLSDLTLGSKTITVVSDVLDAFPTGQLRSVDVYELRGGDESVFYSALKRQSQSLERLSLSATTESALLTWILMECPRLKEFVMHGESQSGSLEIQDLLREPWVYQDLEVFSAPKGTKRWKFTKRPPELMGGAQSVFGGHKEARG